MNSRQEILRFGILRDYKGTEFFKNFGISETEYFLVGIFQNF